MKSEKPFVLIVDDNKTQRRLYQLLADQIGISAHVVPGCREATEALNLTDFDLIIVDWMLPDGDGIECQKELRKKLAKRNMSVPIICITARAMKGDREECLAGGMDDYLAKPFTMDELHDITHKWLKYTDRTIKPSIYRAQH